MPRPKRQPTESLPLQFHETKDSLKPKKCPGSGMTPHRWEKRLVACPVCSQWIKPTKAGKVSHHMMSTKTEIKAG
ncbi:MAG: hypothetical protein L0Y56_10880 [Nitrospira sp.]|nr:hypothetical protein [Nitrospira sp.]